MADVNRGNRPLSPHLSVWKPELNMIMSITHRITGVGLTLGCALVAWWLLAAATSEAYFAWVDGLLTSWIGNLVLLGSVVALWFHTFNGVRHLFWDAGYGFELEKAAKSDRMVLGATAAATLLTIALV